MNIIKTAFLATFFGVFAIISLAIPWYLESLKIINNIAALIGTFIMFFFVMVIGMYIEQKLQ